MSSPWSTHEVRITVEAYLDMLQMELTGLPYNKTAIRKQVLPQLDGRSNGSLEFKNCNISAALLSLGLPPIDGYKPRWNYQRDLLHSVIGEALAGRPGVFDLIEKTIEEPGEEPEPDDILSIFDDEPPEYEATYQSVGESARDPVALKKNYLELESRNRKIGLAGEELVMAYERARLEASGRDNLADRIEHVSAEQGDGAGFDIRSFDDRGDDLFIEVKTTRFRKETPFFISSNEVRFSEANSSRYSLYRVYKLAKEPKLFMLPGNIATRCQLTPTTYRGSFPTS